MFLGLVTLAIGYFISVAIYRLFFHPLAKFPGPFWARVSGFPAYLHTLKQDRHVWFWTLQQQYGPNFRFSPNDVLFNTPTGFKTIFNNKANVKKAEYYELYPRTAEHMTTWNSIDKGMHARKRRVLQQAFSDNALRNAEPFVHANIDRWCELLEDQIGSKEWSGSLNMADWANNLIFDILGDLCFGKSFGMKEPGSELTYVPELMTSFLAIIHPMAFSPFATLWVWLKPRGLDKLMAANAPPALKNWENFVDKCFSERAKVEEDNQMTPNKEARKDFFHYLFSAKDPETGKLGYNRNELFGESESLIIAGSDTTAISTASSLFYLTRNPDVQAKLAKEITSTFSSLDEIKGSVALNCKYLQAFIKEVLRISPPVPADLAREVLPGGMQVDGHFLPPGVRVSTAHYCLQHDEKLYPEPFKFKPERWIVNENDPESAKHVALAESGYCPFSAGTRGCVGKNLAYLEMSVVFAKIIYQFEVRADPSNKLGGGTPDGRDGRKNADEYQLYDIFVGIRNGPMVQFKKRTHA